MEARIIGAARRVFVSKGYEATTMSDVAAEAGIGRTALHYYYRTKDIMFDAVFGQVAASILPDIDRILDDGGTMLQKLPRIITAYADLVRANPDLPLFIVNEQNRAPEHMIRVISRDRERIQPLLRFMRLLEEEMERGIVRRVRKEDLILTIVSLLFFPFLVRKPLTALFMEGQAEAFGAFMDRRRDLAIEVVTRMLTPAGDCGSPHVREEGERNV